MQWLLQGTTFSPHFLLLPLGNVDIVLGVKWLNTLGRILFDLSNITIEFVYQGRKHVLRGASKQLKSAKASSIVKKGGEDTQFFTMTVTNNTQENHSFHNIQVVQGTETSPALTVLLEHYSSIFKISTTLPPHIGSFDHRIPFIGSVNPVNKRPYRYPGVKKDIIEKLIQEMIDQ